MVQGLVCARDQRRAPGVGGNREVGGGRRALLPLLVHDHELHPERAVAPEADPGHGFGSGDGRSGAGVIEARERPVKGDDLVAQRGVGIGARRGVELDQRERLGSLRDQEHRHRRRVLHAVRPQAAGEGTAIPFARAAPGIAAPRAAATAQRRDERHRDDEHTRISRPACSFPLRAPRRASREAFAPGYEPAWGVALDCAEIAIRSRLAPKGAIQAGRRSTRDSARNPRSALQESRRRMNGPVPCHPFPPRCAFG